MVFLRRLNMIFTSGVTVLHDEWGIHSFEVLYVGAAADTYTDFNIDSEGRIYLCNKYGLFRKIPGGQFTKLSSTLISHISFDNDQNAYGCLHITASGRTIYKIDLNGSVTTHATNIEFEYEGEMIPTYINGLIIINNNLYFIGGICLFSQINLTGDFNTLGNMFNEYDYLLGTSDNNLYVIATSSIYGSKGIYKITNQPGSLEYIQSLVVSRKKLDFRFNEFNSDIYFQYTPDVILKQTGGSGSFSNIYSTLPVTTYGYVKIGILPNGNSYAFYADGDVYLKPSGGAWGYLFKLTGASGKPLKVKIFDNKVYVLYENGLFLAGFFYY
jgi:hypothetical protein